MTLGHFLGGVVELVDGAFVDDLFRDRASLSLDGLDLPASGTSLARRHGVGQRVSCIVVASYGA